MKITKLRTYNIKELQKQLVDLQKKFVLFRSKHKSKQLKNFSQLKYIRKDIARILTILKEKELLSNLEPEVKKKEVQIAKKAPKKRIPKKKEVK